MRTTIGYLHPLPPGLLATAAAAHPPFSKTLEPLPEYDIKTAASKILASDFKPHFGTRLFLGI